MSKEDGWTWTKEDEAFSAQIKGLGRMLQAQILAELLAEDDDDDAPADEGTGDE